MRGFDAHPAAPWDWAWITGNPQVIGSPVGLVPSNALVLTGLATFRVVGNPKVILRRGLRNSVTRPNLATIRGR